MTVHGQAKDFLRLTGDPVLRGIDRGETRTVPALIHLGQMAPGRYDEGWIEIHCRTCPASCKQDHVVLRIALVVTAAPAGGASGTSIASPPEGTQVLRCPQAKECEELFRLAKLFDERAADTDARARDAEERQTDRDSEAAQLDDRAQADQADADKHRADARTYDQLADAARRSAAENRRRAAASPAGSDAAREWNEGADRDDTLAARRDADAKQNDARARELEQQAQELRQRADGLRHVAEAARAEADSAWAAADAAWRRYWDCVRRVESQCPPPDVGGTRARPQAVGGVPGSAGGKTAGGTSVAGSPQPPLSRPSGLYLGMHEAVVCHWNSFQPNAQPREPLAKTKPGDSPPSIFVDAVERERILEMDDVSILELAADQLEGHTRSAMGFSYHCTAPGTVVVRYRVTVDLQHGSWRWIRIVCRDSYGWPWEWFE